MIEKLNRDTALIYVIVNNNLFMFLVHVYDTLIFELIINLNVLIQKSHKTSDVRIVNLDAPDDFLLTFILWKT